MHGMTAEGWEHRDMMVNNAALPRRPVEVTNGIDTHSAAPTLAERLARAEQRLANVEEWLEAIAGDLLDRAAEVSLV